MSSTRRARTAKIIGFVGRSGGRRTHYEVVGRRCRSGGPKLISCSSYVLPSSSSSPVPPTTAIVIITSRPQHHTDEQQQRSHQKIRPRNTTRSLIAQLAQDGVSDANELLNLFRDRSGDGFHSLFLVHFLNSSWLRHVLCSAHQEARGSCERPPIIAAGESLRLLVRLHSARGEEVGEESWLLGAGCCYARGGRVWPRLKLPVHQ